MNTKSDFALFYETLGYYIFTLGFGTLILIFCIGIIWAVREDKRRKRIADGYPKAFKPMKISKVVDIKLDDFEDAISN